MEGEREEGKGGVPNESQVVVVESGRKRTQREDTPFFLWVLGPVRRNRSQTILV